MFSRVRLGDVVSSRRLRIGRTVTQNFDHGRPVSLISMFVNFFFRPLKDHPTRSIFITLIYSA